MFVFTFGNLNYDEQHAVVMAETVDEARQLLLTDMAAQAEDADRWPHDPTTINPNWKGRERFDPYYHTTERLETATRVGEPPRAVDGQIVYLHGVDG